MTTIPQPFDLFTLPDFEQWRQVILDGQPIAEYAVSSLGRVKRTYAPNGRTSIGKILSQNADPNGYLQVTLSINAKHFYRRVHILVAEAFIGPTPAGMEVNHKKGVKSNNRHDNLEYTTRQRNCQHAYDTGLRPRRQGEDATNVKLSQFDVDQIRLLLADGLSCPSIADRYGVSAGAISSIKQGKTWKASLRAHP